METVSWIWGFRRQDFKGRDVFPVDEGEKRGLEVGRKPRDSGDPKMISSSGNREELTGPS